MLTIDHRPRPPVGTYVLLGVAALLYAMMLANLVNIGGTDAAGRGLDRAFAGLAGLLLWVVLAVLLVVGGIKGHMPLLAAIVAAILLPASAVAAFVAADLYEQQGGWPILVPALLPLVIAFYALWARMYQQLSQSFPAQSTSIYAGVAVLVMTAGPIAAKWYADRPDPAHKARSAAEERARQEEQQRQTQQVRTREAAAFAQLGPQSSLGDYLPYLRGEYAHAALTDIRLVKSRQTDAIALLQQGRIGDLTELRNFNVEPTPDLCQAFGKALAAAATQVSPQQRPDYISAGIELEGQLPNIKWLVGTRCDLGGALALLETNVRAVTDSPRLTQFADTLGKLRATK